MTTAIPQEIIDSIIDEFKRDKPTLLLCSRVSWSFLTSSRRHLFAHVALRSANQCERLLWLFCSKPEIIHLVQGLYIFSSVNWAHMHTPFQSLLRLFANYGALRIFQFQRMPDKAAALPVTPFPDSSAMSDLLRSSTLTHIILDRFLLCAFPFNLLMITPSLRHFSFMGSKCDVNCSITSPPTFLSPGVSNLRALDIRCVHSGVLLKYIWESLSQLQVLRLPLSFHDRARGAPTALMDSHWNPADLRRLSNLRLVMYEYVPRNSSVSSIISTLRKGGLPPSIECIAIILPYAVSHELYIRDYDLDRQLADIFVTPDAYPLLRDVYYIFVVDGDIPPDSGVMGRFYPFMQKTGLLRCLLLTMEEAQATTREMETSMSEDKSRGKMMSLKATSPGPLDSLSSSILSSMGL